MIETSDEAIVFGTLFAIPFIWMLLKLWLSQQIDFEIPPKETTVTKRAA